MSERVVKQIAIVPEEANGNGPFIVALAEDGTMWVGEVNVHYAGWRQLPPLPRNLDADR